MTLAPLRWHMQPRGRLADRGGRGRRMCGARLATADEGAFGAPEACKIEWRRFFGACGQAMLSGPFLEGRANLKNVPIDGWADWVMATGALAAWPGSKQSQTTGGSGSCLVPRGWH